MLAVRGYYMDKVTAVAVSATASNTVTREQVQLFNVSCNNIRVTVQDNSSSTGTFYNLTCQLPQLNISSSSTIPSYTYPTVVVQLLSPFGSATISVLYFNRTYKSNSAQSTAPTATVTLLLLLIVALAF